MLGCGFCPADRSTARLPSGLDGRIKDAGFGRLQVCQATNGDDGGRTLRPLQPALEVHPKPRTDITSKRKKKAKRKKSTPTGKQAKSASKSDAKRAGKKRRKKGGKKKPAAKPKQPGVKKAKPATAKQKKQAAKELARKPPARQTVQQDQDEKDCLEKKTQPDGGLDDEELPDYTVAPFNIHVFLPNSADEREFGDDANNAVQLN